MPSIAAHMVCAKLVGEELKITSPEFIQGNILPDIIESEDSHRKIKGKYYYIPNIDYFTKKLDLTNDLEIGYLTHLLLDKYYLENYIYDIVNGLDAFISGIIYKDYDIISYKLVKRFNLDINYLNKVLSKFSIQINEKKLENNLRCLNNCDVNAKEYYLDIDDFSKFLIETSKLIVENLKRVIK